MYQKSPIPYLIVLVLIISLSSYSSLTIDRKISEPIVYNINDNSIDKLLAVDKKIETFKDSLVLASSK